MKVCQEFLGILIYSSWYVLQKDIFSQTHSQQDLNKYYHTMFQLKNSPVRRRQFVEATLFITFLLLYPSFLTRHQPIIYIPCTWGVIILSKKVECWFILFLNWNGHHQVTLFACQLHILQVLDKSHSASFMLHKSIGLANQKRPRLFNSNKLTRIFILTHQWKIR